jgi:hypothetical protein
VAAVKITAIHGEQARSNQLGSSRAPMPMVQVYVEGAREALTAILNGVAHRVGSRGQSWRRAIDDIVFELDQHMARGATLISDKSSTATGKGVAAEMLASATVELQADIRHFREGWTAPLKRDWATRFPLLSRPVLWFAAALGALCIAFVSKFLDLS